MEEKKRTNIFIWALFIVLAAAIIFLAVYVFNKQNTADVRENIQVDISQNETVPTVEVSVSEEDDEEENNTEVNASTTGEVNSPITTVETDGSVTIDLPEQGVRPQFDPNFDPLASDTPFVPETFEVQDEPAPEE